MIEPESIRVVIIDDHEVVALGLKALLEDEADMSVVAIATTASDAVHAVEQHRPDVAIIDYRLPDGNGVEVVRAVRAGDDAPGVVMMTAASDRRVMSQALDAGCMSFLSKNADGDDLLASVRAAARGESHFTADVARHLAQVRRYKQFDIDELTARECEVLQLSANGRTPEHIAEELFLSQHTVRNHLRNAMSKLQAHTKLDAVIKAARLRLISIDD
ncbi:MAG: response regulator transcription factor [Acidimicrobiia bacterium]|nr:response regulator transcription factor [Acidimicrobiia bacterium]